MLHLRYLSILLILITFGSSFANAERNSELRRMNKLLKKPTRQLILEFLKGGVRLYGARDLGVLDIDYMFRNDGKAIFSGSFMPLYRSRNPEPFTVSEDTISFECQIESVGGDGTVFQIDDGTFMLTVKQISSDVIVFSDNKNETWKLERCDASRVKNEPPWLGVERWYGKIGDGCLVELMPSSKDMTLYNTLKDKIVNYEIFSGYRDSLIFFAGPMAMTPRIVSEVYYTNDDYIEAAKNIANELKDVLGIVPIKKWQGDWNYDVVVVVGSKVAAKH